MVINPPADNTARNPAESIGPDTHATGDTRLAKRSVVIAGHRTSISLEHMFWRQLKKLAFGRQQSVASLIAEIDASHQATNLSSAIRVFILRQALENDT